MRSRLNKSLVVAICVFVVVVVSPASLLGQWPSYPTAGVPRTGDGKPDLTAPAPRTAEGKPDLSGIWNYAGVLGFRGGPPPSPPGTPPEATFWNIEAGVKDGLPFQPWAAELRKQRMAVESKDNPDASSTRPMWVSGKSSWTDAPLPTTTRSPGGSATREAGGRVTR